MEKSMARKNAHRGLLATETDPLEEILMEGEDDQCYQTTCIEGIGLVLVRLVALPVIILGLMLWGLVMLVLMFVHGLARSLSGLSVDRHATADGPYPETQPIGSSVTTRTARFRWLHHSKTH